MFGTGIKTIMSSALVAATMLGASVPTANAANGINAAINLTFSGQEDFNIQKVQHSQGRRHGGYGHGRRHGPRHGGYGKHRPRPGGYSGHGHGLGGCTPRRALNKAWNIGLKHPHVKHVGRRHIVIKGGYRGARAKVVVSRYGCNVVKFERNYW